MASDLVFQQQGHASFLELPRDGFWECFVEYDDGPKFWLVVYADALSAEASVVERVLSPSSRVVVLARSAAMVGVQPRWCASCNGLILPGELVMKDGLVVAHEACGLRRRGRS